MAMPDLTDALDYMGIDYADYVVTKNVDRALRTAISVLRGSVGDDVEEHLADDPRVHELVLMYADDLYSDRGVSSKVSGATRRLTADMELQLRQELARAREAMT